MCLLQERNDDYGFHFLQDLDNPVVRLTAIGVQERCLNSYYWENHNRLPGYLFQYTLAGSGTLECGGRKYILKKGDGFLLKLPGDERYYFDEAANEAPWKFIYIMFSGETVAPYCRLIEETYGKIIAVPTSHSSIQVLQNLFYDVKHQRHTNPFLLSGAVFQFICCLCGDQPSEEAPYSKKIDQAMDYMKQRFKASINIADVAAYLGVSQHHLSREFYKETGTRPIDFLTKLRMEEAVALLTSTEMKLDAIAETCGFSCGNYFSKVFKKHFQISPAQFRNHIRQEGYSKVQI
ncbi:MAG: helix-turn-helix domain-containing protein [Oscillospiraceae bacterium]|jgi:AraC-like DNA-binding protein